MIFWHITDIIAKNAFSSLKRSLHIFQRLICGRCSSVFYVFICRLVHVLWWYICDRLYHHFSYFIFRTDLVVYLRIISFADDIIKNTMSSFDRSKRIFFFNIVIFWPISLAKACVYLLVDQTIGKGVTSVTDKNMLFVFWSVRRYCSIIHVFIVNNS